MNMNKIDRNIIFFDVETNGFQGSSVLSMSAIKVNYNSEKSEIEKERWTKLEEFNRFYFRGLEKEVLLEVYDEHESRSKSSARGYRNC